MGVKSKSKRKAKRAALALPSSHKPHVKHPEIEKGIPVLKLPLRGEDLFVGRQYHLSPLARVVAMEEFQIGNLPRIVECISKRHPATESMTITTNLDTGATSCGPIVSHPGTEATFVAFLGLYRKRKFTLNLEELHARSKIYTDSPKVKELEEEDPTYRTQRDVRRAREMDKIDVEDLF